MLRRNGCPRLQLNSDPLLGAGMSTTFATHVEVEEESLCATKSLVSIANGFPPIWKVRLCGAPQGIVGADFEFDANAGETVLRMFCTTSAGPPRATAFCS